MSLPLSQVHGSWLPFFQSQQEQLQEIFRGLDGEEITPQRSQIFRAFETPLESVRVVIFGQDPYPGVDVADGLAFSSSAGLPIPASLKNIFKEYHSDLGYPTPTSPDLAQWSKAGIMLLNRTLTNVPRERNAHLKRGWNNFTLEVAKLLGRSDVVAILWGNYARELAPYFPYRIESPHPSPLSARLGFFGSRPFSQANALLQEIGRRPVDWKL